MRRLIETLAIRPLTPSHSFPPPMPPRLPRSLVVRGSLLFLAVLLTVSATRAQDAADDHAAVRQAALDYVEALYEADPARIERSVARDLAKIGYFRPSGDADYGLAPMTYDQLHALAARWNADGQRADPATVPKAITIHTVRNRTAALSLEAAWGVDHMQLAKGDDGRWRIVHVLWESP